MLQRSHGFHCRTLKYHLSDTQIYTSTFLICESNTMFKKWSAFFDCQMYFYFKQKKSNFMEEFKRLFTKLPFGQLFPAHYAYIPNQKSKSNCFFALKVCGQKWHDEGCEFSVVFWIYSKIIKLMKEIQMRILLIKLIYYEKWENETNAFRKF